MKYLVTLLLTALAILGCSDNKQAGVSTGRLLGANSSVGKGTVSSYAEFDKNGAPKAIGIVFQASALDGLPTEDSDGHHCFDRDKDGKIDLQKECMGAHEWIIPLPSEAARRSDIPFKWAGLNWNPHGHIPPKVYDLPHFDIHFYIEPIEKVFADRIGALRTRICPLRPVRGGHEAAAVKLRASRLQERGCGGACNGQSPD